MLPEKIIFFTTLLSFVGYTFYIKNIIRGHTKPNLVSWFIWMLPPFIGVFFQLKAGAGLSILPVFMAGFGPLIIIMAVLLTKNAIWKISTFDIYCGIFALLALVIYIFTRNLGISILFAIASDALAFIPTYIKTWRFPESESVHGYFWTMLSNIVALLIIKNWTFTIYSFSMYLVIANVIMLCILYRKKIFNFS